MSEPDVPVVPLWPGHLLSILFLGLLTAGGIGVIGVMEAPGNFPFALVDPDHLETLFVAGLAGTVLVIAAGLVSALVLAWLRRRIRRVARALGEPVRVATHGFQDPESGPTHGVLAIGEEDLIFRPFEERDRAGRTRVPLDRILSFREPRTTTIDLSDQGPLEVETPGETHRWKVSNPRRFREELAEAVGTRDRPAADGARDAEPPSDPVVPPGPWIWNQIAGASMLFLLVFVPIGTVLYLSQSLPPWTAYLGAIVVPVTAGALVVGLLRVRHEETRLHLRQLADEHELGEPLHLAAAAGRRDPDRTRFSFRRGRLLLTATRLAFRPRDPDDVHLAVTLPLEDTREVEATGSVLHRFLALMEPVRIRTEDETVEMSVIPWEEVRERMEKLRQGPGPGAEADGDYQGSSIGSPSGS